MKESEEITVPLLRDFKKRGEKISMITAYDYPSAILVDKAGIEIILVGDSVGNTVLGYEDTIPVTLEDMLHHTKAVTRGAKKPLVVSDLPFMSYNVSVEQAIENAGRLMKEGGADAIKLEGGQEMAQTTETLTRAGIPVMGHIGLTPQRASQLGGFKVQGRDLGQAKKLLQDAHHLAKAGVFSLILECVPYQLARLITNKSEIPTIGIGAGPYCDGQVLVLHDLLGLSFGFSPKFVKQYVGLSQITTDALTTFKEEVKKEIFPSVEKYSFSLGEEVLEKLEYEGD